MVQIRRFLTAALIVLLGLASAAARTITIEFLQDPINEATVANLDDLACRNLDRIVHLKIAVNWPADKLDEERTGYKRLVFWNDKAEYLFPEGSFVYLHGDYIINGYFIPRSGGIHQGINEQTVGRLDGLACHNLDRASFISRSP